MSVHIDVNGDTTTSVCNGCQAQVTTIGANGRVPPEWGTAQMWIDVSLGNQTNAHLCFCPTCFGQIALAMPIALKVEVI